MWNAKIYIFLSLVKLSLFELGFVCSILNNEINCKNNGGPHWNPNFTIWNSNSDEKLIQTCRYQIALMNRFFKKLFK